MMMGDYMERELNSPIFNYLKARNLGYERIAYISSSIQPLFNVPLRISTLNGYDPLIMNNFHQLTGISTNGTSNQWDFLLRNNLILSSFNARYLILQDSPIDGAELEKMKCETGQISVPTTKIALDKWHLLNMTVNKNGYRLQSPDGKQVSMIYQRAQLRPNTYYLLSLKARPWKESPGVLVFDIYAGPEYDFPEQEMYFYPSYQKRSFEMYLKVVNTRAKMPNQVTLRIFTFSQVPITVKDIEVIELQNYIPPFIETNNPGETATALPLYRKVFETTSGQVFENRNCLPRAYSIRNIKAINSLDELKRQFYILGFDPANTALVQTADIEQIGSTLFSQGSVSIREYTPDKITIDTDFPDQGFIVLSDQFFPGWKAFIDGKETRIYRVNGCVRGIVSPGGRHEVVFKYVPVRIYVAAIVSLATLSLCILSLLLMRLRYR